MYADITQVAHRDAHDSSAFGMAVLRDALVAIVPGDDFGFAAPKQHVRFSYATKYERIEQAFDRLARLLRR